MNQKLPIILLMLGMMTFMPSICFALGKEDTIVLNRMWSYAQKYAKSANGLEKNVYMNYTFQTKRRNVTLFLIPTMYSIAKGHKDYFGESYYKLQFHDINKYDAKRQVVYSTIPSYRNVMPTLIQYMTPNLYDTSLYQGHLLSPFNRANHHFYNYKVHFADSNPCIIQFTPRMSNTQLIKGHAVVNTLTGHIMSFFYEGDYDMLNFKVKALMNKDSTNIALPEHCSIESTFKFLGNNIKANLSAYYNCPITLPDSLKESHDYALMDTLRPIQLTEMQQEIYQRYIQDQQADTASTEARKSHKFRDFMWNVVGDNLVNSLHAGSGAATLRISPLLNPLYFGYSKTRGISYKLNIGARYSWNTHRYLSLEPDLGYNFKLRQFFYTAPLRMTYNPKRNGYAEITWANGNRVNNGALIEAVRKELGENFDVPEYKDEYIQIVNNVEAFNWLEIMTGVAYHRRSSTNKQLMESVGLEPIYRSFAPLITLKFKPWTKGPLLTANYMHSFKNVMKSNLIYDRWEFDLSYKHNMNGLRYVNMRVGTGFYTSRNTDYFVDFINFRDNNLPSGWEDDWTGQFQLLDSQWYNESNYYIRCNISYESPLLALTWLPLVGRFLETERLYFSALNIENTRPYWEIGYGFTCRYFSTGVFASFLNTKYKEFGCRFTFELFRKW